MFLFQVSKSTVFCRALVRPEKGAQALGPAPGKGALQADPAGRQTFGDNAIASIPDPVVAVVVPAIARL